MTDYLATPEGQAYAKFVTGHRTAIVDFDMDSEECETNISKVLRDVPLAQANSVSSLSFPRGAPKLKDGTPSHFDEPTHRPMLDIDMPAILMPSTNPNHYHLYLDCPMPWSSYEKLLKVLGEVGIIQEGFMRASIEREASWVRTPWTRKGQ